MWTVRETRAAQKAINRLQPEIKKKYTLWLNIVRQSGPQGLRPIPGFHDEALVGNRSGMRSSRLNDAWRVIYSVEADTVTVEVENVTHHDYR
jgi:proteic killer suppression protein